jgi:3-phenylpropionate/trans-cinnamate dioxygenase ferredoxin subunit
MRIMALQKLCDVAEFPAEGKKSFKVEGKDLAVFSIDENYYCIDGKCSHMGGSLIDGKLEGKWIKCPKHGAVFNLETGEVTEQVGKMFGILKKAKNMKTYPVQIQDDALFVEL